MKKALLLVLALMDCAFAAQAQTPNIDFETGTYANWLYYKGACCPGGNIVATTLSAALPTSHALTSGAIDTFGGFPTTSPWGGTYSMKLGNDSTGRGSERCRYYVHIPTGSTSYSLIYHYAVVLQDPAHSPADQPRMEIKASDSATGSILPCNNFSYVLDSALPGFVRSTVDTLVYYLPWKMGNFKLNGLGGRTIAIDFATGDCDLGGHFGYGYFDMSAGLFVNTISICGASSTVTLSGPAGYSAYSWRDSATFSVSYGSSQTVAITTPTITTTYAVILTPHAGYGCADTLYTRVFIEALCTGTPATGTASAYRSAICSNPDTLKVSGFATTCGLTYQWQSSVDNATWSNMPGATTAVYPYYYPYTSLYYRCAVTCSSGGAMTNSSSVYVPRGSGPGLYTTSNPPNVTCTGGSFYVSTCGPSSAFNVTTWYGDGTSDNKPLSTAGVKYANFTHNYAYPGTYSIKQVLYDGTMAVDSSAYSYLYFHCNSLPIRLYVDANHDGIRNIGEYAPSLPVYVQIDSNSIPLDTISITGSMNYRALGGPGTIYSFSILSDHLYVTSPPSGVIHDTINILVNDYPANDFGVDCSSTPSRDLSVNVAVRTSGRNDLWGYAYIQNKGCVLTSPTLTMNFSPKWDYTRVGSTPTTTSWNTATWDMPFLSSLDSDPFRIYFVLWSNPTTGLLTIGDTTNSIFTVTPVVGDINTTNNIVIRNDTVKAGCDPNLIVVSPTECFPYPTGVKKLEYTIHFENTGNDTAHNIHVLDTLSDNLDVNSMEIVLASHRMNVMHYRDGGKNIVKFDFPDIKLLDSSHHGLCDGAVIYTINTKPGLTEGERIYARAGIYFDINEVVLTNTVENRIGCPTVSVNKVTKQNTLQIFPNPANDELTIKTDELAYTSFIITNTVGQVMIEDKLNGTQTKVNIKQLPSGIYYISVKGEFGNTVKKFVKM